MKRLMTKDEAVEWSMSNEADKWEVSISPVKPDSWWSPVNYDYDAAISEYRRRKIGDSGGDTLLETERPLSVLDAVKLMMLEGKTLVSAEGNTAHYDASEGFRFCNSKTCISTGLQLFDIWYPQPEKKTRLMTRWECMQWAQSEESRGWLVRRNGDWISPVSFNYRLESTYYKRARFDSNGIIEGTECGFEVEVDI
jgi:hypothetical protein